MKRMQDSQQEWRWLHHIEDISQQVRLHCLHYLHCLRFPAAAAAASLLLCGHITMVPLIIMINLADGIKTSSRQMVWRNHFSIFDTAALLLATLAV